jgi:hypothetical protein
VTTQFTAEPPVTEYAAEYDRLVELGFDRTTAARVATAPPLTNEQSSVIRAAFCGVHS